MNNNLLILGSENYGMTAFEIAKSMNCFKKISLIDNTPKLEELAISYSNIIIAEADSSKRQKMLNLAEELPFRIVTLISPKAYIEPTAQIMKGCIIEPFAAINTGCVISRGCIISSGAVIQQNSVCFECVNIEPNATVKRNSFVGAGKTVKSGTVHHKTALNNADFFIALDTVAPNNDISKRRPTTINGLNYSFEDGV